MSLHVLTYPYIPLHTLQYIQCRVYTVPCLHSAVSALVSHYFIVELSSMHDTMLALISFLNVRSTALHHRKALGNATNKMRNTCPQTCFAANLVLQRTTRCDHAEFIVEAIKGH